MALLFLSLSHPHISALILRTTQLCSSLMYYHMTSCFCSSFPISFVRYGGCGLHFHRYTLYSVLVLIAMASMEISSWRDEMGIDNRRT
jgi:hypothetical protein